MKSRIFEQFWTSCSPLVTLMNTKTFFTVTKSLTLKLWRHLWTTPYNIVLKTHFSASLKWYCLYNHVPNLVAHFRRNFLCFTDTQNITHIIYWICVQNCIYKYGLQTSKIVKQKICVVSTFFILDLRLFLIYFH